MKLTRYIYLVAALVAAFLLISPAKAQSPACTTAVQAAEVVKGQGGKIEKYIKDPKLIDMVAAFVSAPLGSSVVEEIYVYSKPMTQTFAMAFYGKDGCLLAAAQIQEHHLQSFFGSEWREFSL